MIIYDNNEDQIIDDQLQQNKKIYSYSENVDIKQKPTAVSQKEMSYIAKSVAKNRFKNK